MRVLISFATLLAALISLWPQTSPAAANALVYHRFGDARFASTNIAIETFERQLRYLKEQGITVLSLGDVAARLRAAEALPERCVVLTIDDAYVSFLTGAVPLLKAYGYPATLFVNTASVGRGGYLSWPQLREVVEAGIEIGNHSHTHDYLLERRPGETEKHWRERVRNDLSLAQQLLEKNLGVSPRVFAYPYGEYSPELQRIVAELGFVAAAAQQSGVIDAGSDLLALPRFPMGGAYATVEDFVGKTTMRPLPLTVVEPLGPVLGSENPPRLVVDIDTEAVAAQDLRLFVNGVRSGAITPDPDRPGRFVVQAERPLTGRRSKYTLTAPRWGGQGWYWFSQLWIELSHKEAR